MPECYRYNMIGSLSRLELFLIKLHSLYFQISTLAFTLFLQSIHNTDYCARNSIPAITICLVGLSKVIRGQAQNALSGEEKSITAWVKCPVVRSGVVITQLGSKSWSRGDKGCEATLNGLTNDERDLLVDFGKITCNLYLLRAHKIGVV